MGPRHRPWATGLPAGATAAILRRLPCRADRAKMAAVCSAWRARAQGVGAPDRPPALPWLLLPDDGGTRVHCFLSDYHAHHLIGAPPHGDRYFGSHDGAWLFLARYDQAHAHRHVLRNLRGGGVRALPGMVWTHTGDHDMAMLAAALSAPPDDPNCFGACIFVTHPAPADGPVLRRFAFWRMGTLVANDFMDDPVPEPLPGWPGPAELEVEDVVFHEGAFHFLTGGEHVYVCQPLFDGDVPMLLVPLNRFEQPGPRDYGNLVVRARYLVASGMELLMVVRFTHPGEDQWMRTSLFRVFRAIPPVEDEGEEVGHQDVEEDEEQGEEDDQDADGDDEADEVGDQGTEEDEEAGDQDVEEDDDQGNEAGDHQVVEYPWSWGELDTLDGRMLFVGRGCSKSYQVANYPGFTAGVYFSDDHTFYDEEMMFLGANERQYSCHDNGKWLEGTPPIVMHSPMENPSNNSSPTWLLP